MNKIIFVLFACIFLLCSCGSSNNKSENFGIGYTEENKYMAMLPDDISVPIEYLDVVKLKGASQYSGKSENIPSWLDYCSLYYDTIFFDKPCILGLDFEKDKLKELTYIFECEDKKENEKTAQYIYNCLENCYSKPNNELTDYVTWNTYKDNYMINLMIFQNSVIVTMKLSDELSGINDPIDTFSTTKATTTTESQYEFVLNTDSTGYDWIKADDIEKEVWCSNSITAWKLMGYDIPSGVTIKSMTKAIDDLYKDDKYLKYDLVTISEMFAIANDIY